MNLEYINNYKFCRQLLNSEPPTLVQLYSLDLHNSLNRQEFNYDLGLGAVLPKVELGIMFWGGGGGGERAILSYLIPNSKKVTIKLSYMQKFSSLL